MDTKLKLMTAGGALAVIALPLLYYGGIDKNSTLMTIGFILFGVGILLGTILKFVKLGEE